MAVTYFIAPTGVQGQARTSASAGQLLLQGLTLAVAALYPTCSTGTIPPARLSYTEEGGREQHSSRPNPPPLAMPLTPAGSPCFALALCMLTPHRCGQTTTATLPWPVSPPSPVCPPNSPPRTQGHVSPGLYQTSV